MAEITRTMSTRCLVENSQRVNATSQYNNSGNFKMFKMDERSDGCSGETLLAHCTRKKKLQRKMTRYYY